MCIFVNNSPGGSSNCLIYVVIKFVSCVVNHSRICTIMKFMVHIVAMKTFIVKNVIFF